MPAKLTPKERQQCLDEVQRIAAKYPNRKLSAEFLRHRTILDPGLRGKCIGHLAALLQSADLLHRGRAIKGAVNKTVVPPVPMSEDPNKPKDASEQACVDDLKKLALANPDKVLSRNFYRVNGMFAESCWGRYFGTFEEFKRQAGVKLSRQQHHLEKQLAKHASVDHYRNFNVERSKFAEKYIRPNSARFQLALCAADFHDQEADPFVLRVFLDTARRAQPDLVVLNGDIFDLPEFGKFTQDPRTWNVVGRIEFAHKHILKPLREAAPNAQIDFIEGNHEFRLMRHLADATPAMRSVLADLHGFTVAKLLGLEQFEINYVAKADLAAYTSKDIKEEVRRNFKIYHNCWLAHHEPEGRAMGVPGFCGHNHKFEAWPMSSAVFGGYSFLQLGAVHRTAATYCDGEKWSNGFLLAHIDTKTQQTCPEYIDVRDHAAVGGKYYFREAGER